MYLKFHHYLNPWYIISAKFNLSKYVIFIKLRIFGTAEIKRFTASCFHWVKGVCKHFYFSLHLQRQTTFVTSCFSFLFFFYDEALAKWKRKPDFVTLRLSFILLHILILWFLNVFIYLCVFIDIMILYVFIYIILFFSRYACTVCLNFVNSRLKMISHRQVAIVTVGLGEAQHVKAFPF